MVNAMSWYDTNAKAVSKRYEEVASESVHRWMMMREIL